MLESTVSYTVYHRNESGLRVRKLPTIVRW